MMMSGQVICQQKSIAIPVSENKNLIAPVQVSFFTNYKPDLTSVNLGFSNMSSSLPVFLGLSGEVWRASGKQTECACSQSLISKTSATRSSSMNTGSPLQVMRGGLKL
jgi:hypothetical protein